MYMSPPSVLLAAAAARRSRAAILRCRPSAPSSSAPQPRDGGYPSRCASSAAGGPLLPRPVAATAARQPRPRPRTRTARRDMSDNLLGHSPMAPKVAPPKAAAGATPQASAIWGVSPAPGGTGGDGGVWAQTSSKRDKMNELKGELANMKDEEGRKITSLDGAATAEEKYDLWFADGLAAIAGASDGVARPDESWGDADVDTIAGEATSDGERRVLEEVLGRGKEAARVAEELEQWLNSPSESEEWTRERYEANLDEATRILSAGLPAIPPTKPKEFDAASLGRSDPHDPLFYVQDFVGDAPGGVGDSDKGREEPRGDDDATEEERRADRVARAAFASATRLHRTLLVRSVAATLRENWDRIAATTDGDVDRAAVVGLSAEPSAPSLRARDVRAVLSAYESGPCSAWVEAWWNLLDKDGDGMIDEAEMTAVVELSLEPAHRAMKELVALSANVRPIRVGASTAEDRAAEAASVGGASGGPVPEDGEQERLGWRDRRKESKARASFLSLFSNTASRHFPEQVELPHRLRCIYAWAKKSHQGGEVDPVLVDASNDWGTGAASAMMGRKRHVELQPKISHGEFVEMQTQHMPHLDRVGREVAESFREDMWVVQGKGRQNRELKRDCVVFLVGVGLLDIGIGFL